MASRAQWVRFNTFDDLEVAAEMVAALTMMNITLLEQMHGTQALNTDTIADTIKAKSSMHRAQSTVSVKQARPLSFCHNAASADAALWRIATRSLASWWAARMHC